MKVNAPLRDVGRLVSVIDMSAPSLRDGGGCYLRGARDSCHRGCSGCVSLDGISRRRRS